MAGIVAAFPNPFAHILGDIKITSSLRNSDPMFPDHLNSMSMKPAARHFGMGTGNHADKDASNQGPVLW